MSRKKNAEDDTFFQKKNAEDDTFFQTNFNKTANIYLAQRFKTILRDIESFIISRTEAS